MTGEIWQPAQIHITEGDVITSKKGFLVKGHLTSKFQKCYRLEFLGDNTWLLGEKREYIDVKVYNHGAAKGGQNPQATKKVSESVVTSKPPRKSPNSSHKGMKYHKHGFPLKEFEEGAKE